MTLHLPWPPSVNTYWRNVNGRTVLSRKGREYRTEVAYASVNQLAPTFASQRLSLTLTAHPPDRRRRDLDNICKGILDGLERAGVYADDSQIDHLEIVRGEVRKPGVVIVNLVEMEGN